MGIARGWEKLVIRTNITYAKRTVRIFSVSPQSRSLFSASFQTFRLTARAYLNTQKYGLFCSLSPFIIYAMSLMFNKMAESCVAIVDDLLFLCFYCNIYEMKPDIF